MKKWWNSLNRTAKIMLLLIVLFIIAIATRWEYVKKETIEAFRGRFTVEKPARPGSDSISLPNKAIPADSTTEIGQ